MLSMPLSVAAQVFGQNQVIVAPYGGFVYSQNTTATSKLAATSSPFFTTFRFATGTGGSLCLSGTCLSAWPSAGASFPFTPVSYGNATGTTLGFLNGFVSPASSTVSGSFHLGLSSGALGIFGGLVTSISTSTPTVSAPITYSGTLGQFLTGVSGAFGCTSASAGVTGCLTGTDWSTFNAKESLLSFVTPLIRTANSIAWVGLATTSQPASSNLLTSNGGAGVYGTATTSATCTGNATCSPFTVIGPSPITINVSAGTAASSTLLGDSNTFSGTINKFTNAPALAISGLIKGNGSGAITAGVNGTDYTLISAITCSGVQFINAVTAAGVFTCGTPAGTTYTGTYPIIVTGSVISTGFGTTTTWGMGNNGLVMTGATGIPFATATSSPVNLNISGNAATVTTNANLTGVVTSSGNVTSYGSQSAGVLGNPATGNTAVQATSTLYGAVQNGKVLAGSNGSLQYVATSTDTCSTGITCAYAAGNNAFSIANSAITDAMLASTFVKTLTVASTNGFAGSFTAGATPVLTISTSITGLLKGNGTAISAAALTDFPAIGANTFLANGTGGSAAPTAIATSSIFGPGTGGQILAWNNGVPQWVASTTYSSGLAFAGGNVTNTGVTSIVAGTNITVSGATGAVTVNCPSCTGGGSAYPFTPSTDGGINTSATSTPIQGTNPGLGLDVSVTSWYGLGGKLLAYASTTNDATIFGLNAGGQGATTTSLTSSISAFGSKALSANTTGFENSAFGVQALQLNTTGSDNTAIGMLSLSKAVSASFNTALGYEALQNTTGSGNTAAGYQSLVTNTTGTNNTVYGIRAGRSVTTGYSNTIIGGHSVLTPTSITSGFGNIGLGENVFFPNAAGNLQLSIGNFIYGSLPATTTAFGVPTSGAIGIGTTSPFATLSVHANNGSTNTVLFAIGSSTATATTTLFDVDNTGNASHLGNLTVGTGRSANPGTQLFLYNTNTAGASPSMVLGGNPGGDTDFWMGRQNDNDGTNNDFLQIGAGLTPGTTPYLSLNSTGNFGVGTTTPSKLFTVYGNQSGGIARIERFNAATNAVLGTYSITAETTGTAADGFGVGQTFELVSDGVNPNTYNTLSTITAFRHGADNTGSLGLFAYVAGSPSTANLVLDGLTGIIAIGSSTPSSTLCQTFCTTNATVSGISNVAGTASPVVSIFQSSFTGLFAAIGTLTNHAFVFLTNNTERMRLTAGGYLGIGTTTPQWIANIASSTAPQLALSSNSASGNFHWTFNNIFGNLFLATSSATTFATSTNADPNTGFIEFPNNGGCIGCTDITFADGINLRNAKYVSATSTNLATTFMDMYTAPAGRRAYVQAYSLFAYTGSVTVSPWVKISGVYYRVGATTTSTGSIASSPVGFVLEPNETVSLFQSAATANGWVSIVEYDATVPFYTSRQTGTLSATSTVYTVPSNVTAAVCSTQNVGAGSGASFQVGNNSVSTPTLKAYVVKSGQAALDSGNKIASQALSANSSTVINVAGTAGNLGCISMNSGDSIQNNLSTSITAGIQWTTVYEH